MRRTPWKRVKKTKRQLNPNRLRAHYARHTDEALLYAQERTLSAITRVATEGARRDEFETLAEFFEDCRLDAAYGLGRSLATIAKEIKKRGLQ